MAVEAVGDRLIDDLVAILRGLGEQAEPWHLRPPETAGEPAKLLVGARVGLVRGRLEGEGFTVRDLDLPVERLRDAREYIDELIEWSERPVKEADLPSDADTLNEDDENAEKGGTIVLEKVTCGDETCKCLREGEKHGPYRKRYYRKPAGTLTSEYLGKP